MFPFCDSPMDLPLYQQLQLSPPSPKPDPEEDHHHQSSFFFYHSSPAFAGSDADAAFHHNSCYLDPGAAAATLPSADIDFSPPPELSLMDQAPAAPHPTAGNTERHGSDSGAGALESSRAAAAARKDRHSKICTAGGMRDRRMRLSLDVARKFFALQDMLGFDKASKTVQWLLNTSKSAIREVMAPHSSACEEDDDGSSSISLSNMPAPEKTTGDDRGEGKKKPRAARSSRAASNPKPSSRKSGGANAHTIPDKESRSKARERARERTKEKNRMRWVTLASTINLESADELTMTSPPNSNILKYRSSSSSMNTAVSAKLEDRCSSSTATNGGRTVQEASIASHAIMAGAFGDGGIYGSSGSGSNYYYQHQQLEEQQWELGGVVFANSRLY